MWARLIFVGLFGVVAAALWLTAGGTDEGLLYEVGVLGQVAAFETKWLYLSLHVFIYVPVLLLSFDRRVAYYRRWASLWRAVLPVALFFLVWDVYFTQIGVWGFNPAYYSPYLLYGLPLGEWLFFVTVPFACVFIYACIGYYMPTKWIQAITKPLDIGLACLFVIVGLLYWGRWYTCSAFMLAGGLMWYHVFFVRHLHLSHFYLAYLCSLLPFCIVNGVLTGGFTQAPVVVYNPQSYLGIRVGTIPVDDFVYSFALLLANISLFAYFQQRRAT